MEASQNRPAEGCEPSAAKTEIPNFSARLRSFAKDVLHAIAGQDHPVEGLGFEIDKHFHAPPEAREAVLDKIVRIDQSKVWWRTKLRAGALITRLETEAVETSPPRSNIEALRLIERALEPGDILFIGSDGPKEPALVEGFDTGLRLLSAHIPKDRTFPFRHVAVIGPNRTALHITPSGIHEEDFISLFVERPESCDAVAVGRLALPADDRHRLGESAAAFLEGKKYNMSWIAFGAPFEILKCRFLGGKPIDRSATATHAVCVDVATEPARALAAEPDELTAPTSAAALADIAAAMTPLDLFSHPALRIIDAVALHRG